MACHGFGFAFDPDRLGLRSVFGVDLFRLQRFEWCRERLGAFIGEDLICGMVLIDEVGTGVMAWDGSTRWGLG